MHVDDQGEYGKIPVDRFLDRVFELISQDLSEKEAVKIALQEKRYEQEALEIEEEVCKQQAEVRRSQPFLCPLLPFSALFQNHSTFCFSQMF